MTKEYRYVGKSTERMAGLDFVTGKAKYAYDLRIPHMLYAKVLRSPYAYAKIISIDTAEAEQLPGVRKVMTYKNAPDWKIGMPMPHKKVFSDTVHFIGDIVAAVAADTEDIAEEALGLIQVKYKVMKPVLTIKEAMAEGAPELYPELPHNMVPPKMFEEIGYAILNVQCGDLNKGFEEADIIIETSSSTNNEQNPLPPESPGIISDWEKEDILNVYGSTSSVGIVQLMNAPSMNIPVSNLHVHPAYVGASYGSKHLSSNGTIIFITAALAKATHRPVGLFYTRAEHLTVHTRRLASDCHIKMGMKKDGTVTAIQGEWNSDAGYYVGEHGLMVGVGLGALAINTKCANMDFNTNIAVTNQMGSNAFRGFGYLELCAHLSYALFQGLEKINMDPVEYYMKHSLFKGDHFYHAYMCVGDAVCAGPDLRKAMTIGAEKFNWKERWKGYGVPTKVEGDIITAVGFGLSGHTDPGEQASNESVELVWDGGVKVFCAATEFGTGTRDVMRIITAEILNVDINRVHVSDPGTMNSPYEWGSTGSRSTYAMGASIKKAAEKAKKELLEKAAAIYQCPAQAVETKDGMVNIIGHPESAMPWVAVTGVNGSIIGSGHFPGKYGSVCAQGQFIEIQLDKRTGRIHVTEELCVTDSGQTINAAAMKGQLDGFFPGIDMAIMEDTVVDHDGRIVSANMIDYKTRTFNEIPKHENIVTESALEDPDAAFGAVGVGEPTLSPAIPAVTLAVYNAIGVWISDLPISPKRILDVLKEKEGE